MSIENLLQWRKVTVKELTLQYKRHEYQKCGKALCMRSGSLCQG